MGRSKRRGPERGGARTKGPRPFWSGVVTFGLVSVPVDLHPAIRSNRPRLRMLTPDGVPLKRRYLCPHDDTYVESKALVRGYELDDGSHVIVTDEELEALEPKRTRSIELRRFVPIASVDPARFESAYFLAPAGEALEPYRLLADVMERTGRAGIATFVMRGRDYLAAILAKDGVLCAETLRFSDELRTPGDVGLPEPAKAPRALLRRMQSALDDIQADELDESEMVDPQARALEELVRAKAEKGLDVVDSPLGPETEGEARVDDLIATLQRSMRRLALEGDRRSADRAG